MAFLKFALLWFTVAFLTNTAASSASKTANTLLHPPSDKFIVLLHHDYTHDHFEQFMRTSVLKESSSMTSESVMTVHHRYSLLMHGVVVSGLIEESIRKHPGVKDIFQDKVVSNPIEPIQSVHTTTVRSWGLDRINEKDLPLDASSASAYNGRGVDVYIVDSGLDTLHVEFIANPSGRVVQNIWAAPSYELNANNDDNGHGTHVAGTVGGNSAGVSPSANLYGVKVLNAVGDGYTSDIIAGLEAVGTKHLTSGRPSIVNMSLGGLCDNYYCETDPLIVASYVLTTMGVVVVAAAGNDASYACYYSPASLTKAVTVAASEIYDTEPYYSNVGECVDIYAPGSYITSACSSLVRSCLGTETLYSTLSGTSMAAPHVAGVAAQILQISPTLTPDDVSASLSCLAVKDRIYNASPNTKNELLQVPKLNDPCVKTATKPSMMPLKNTSSKPSWRPTARPSKRPTAKPSSTTASIKPTLKPSMQQSIKASQKPSRRPTARPTKRPTAKPSSTTASIKPTLKPSMQQSIKASQKPSRRPTARPTKRPTAKPSSTTASIKPTLKPSMQHSIKASQKPSRRPTAKPILMTVSKSPSNL